MQRQEVAGEDFLVRRGQVETVVAEDQAVLAFDPDQRLAGVPQVVAGQNQALAAGRRVAKADGVFGGINGVRVIDFSWQAGQAFSLFNLEGAAWLACPASTFPVVPSM